MIPELSDTGATGVMGVMGVIGRLQKGEAASCLLLISVSASMDDPFVQSK